MYKITQPSIIFKQDMRQIIARERKIYGSIAKIFAIALCHIKYRMAYKGSCNQKRNELNNFSQFINQYEDVERKKPSFGVPFRKRIGSWFHNPNKKARSSGRKLISNALWRKITLNKTTIKKGPSHSPEELVLQEIHNTLNIGRITQY
ncbi:Meiosis regulator and mRNA stability factor [Dirofilaria immitis]